jgi:hypothetical protein
LFASSDNFSCFSCILSSFSMVSVSFWSNSNCLNNSSDRSSSFSMSLFSSFWRILCVLAYFLCFSQYFAIGNESYFIVLPYFTRFGCNHINSLFYDILSVLAYILQVSKAGAGPIKLKRFDRYTETA